MPFVTPEHRDKPDLTVVGDRCYLHYKRMVDKWKEVPRWTTAHNIYKALMIARRDTNIVDDLAARELAWQVFFQKYVMVYEDEKEIENGSI